MANGNKKAFDAARGTTFLFDPDDLMIIGLDTPDGADHPLYDPRVTHPLDEDDIANVDYYGIINPVTITKRDGVPTVVAGRGRVRRARAAKLRQQTRGEKQTIRVPCIVRNGDDNKLMGLMISENEGRRDDDVSARLAKIHRMLDRSVPLDDIARDFHVSVKTIDGWLTLGGACKELRHAEASGQISTSAAVKLARLPFEEQPAVLATVVAEGGSSTTAARRVTSKRKGTSASADGVGVISRKAQKKMHLFAQGTEDEDDDPYFDGAADALALILGLDVKPKNAAKAKKLLKASDK